MFCGIGNKHLCLCAGVLSLDVLLGCNSRARHEVRCKICLPTVFVCGSVLQAVPFLRQIHLLHRTASGPSCVSRIPNAVQHGLHPAATYAGTLKCLQASLKQKKVLLCGPMESGKTTLFHALQGHTLPSGTVTSMVTSVAVCTLPVRCFNGRLAASCSVEIHLSVQVP